jgi:hypothetical protein
LSALSSLLWREMENVWVPRFNFLSIFSLFKANRRNWAFLFNFSLPNFSLSYFTQTKHTLSVTQSIFFTSFSLIIYLEKKV